ncbi:hypothetical protein FKM82_011435 [Ascaphus truei]
MEQKLAEFRARKEQVQHESGKANEGAAKGHGEPKPKGESVTATVREKLQHLWRGSGKMDEASETLISNQGTEALHRNLTIPAEHVSNAFVQPSQDSRLNVTLLLKFLLWLVLLGLFVELEFGLAYFLLSMFYWLYEGTRGPGERRKGEKSAYSVFNPGCEAIQGTLNAEQFERELQYGTMAGI